MAQAWVMLQVLRSILDRPEEGSGTIERQATAAKTLAMMAKVHKVICFKHCHRHYSLLCALCLCPYVSFSVLFGKNQTGLL